MGSFLVPSEGPLREWGTTEAQGGKAIGHYPNLEQLSTLLKACEFDMITCRTTQLNCKFTAVKSEQNSLFTVDLSKNLFLDDYTRERVPISRTMYGDTIETICQFLERPEAMVMILYGLLRTEYSYGQAPKLYKGTRRAAD